MIFYSQYTKTSPLMDFHPLLCSLRPWDPMNDLVQYEHEYIISTKTRHRTPIVRTTSITNMEEDKRKCSQSPIERARLSRIKRMSMKRLATIPARGSESSTPDIDKQVQRDSESSESDGKWWASDHKLWGIIISAGQVEGKGQEVMKLKKEGRKVVRITHEKSRFDLLLLTHRVSYTPVCNKLPACIRYC